MKIFGAAEVHRIDAYTIKNEPVSSIDLMERAALSLTGWYIRHYHVDRRVIIFAGPGNNGGDALALARQLADRQYRVECYLLRFGKMSGDCTINRQRLEDQGEVQIREIGEGDPLTQIASSDVVVDGIFGSGLSRKVEGLPAKVIRHIITQANLTISIDIPSGLLGEDNSANDYSTIIRATYTLTFQFPFLSFFFSDNHKQVGEWRVLDIGLHPGIIDTADVSYQSIEKEQVRGMLPVRPRFSHKGSYGHGLIISGSYGMMGAALLAGESCLRGGAGLATVHVPRFGYNIIQTALPEALISLDQSDILFSDSPDLEPFTSIGIGPGLGCKPNTAKGLRMLLERVRVPLVIDADGLNILSSHPEWLDLLPNGTILTPHPKEFDRLAGKSASAYERHKKQRDFASKYKVIVVLKGAYTGIATPEGPYWINTTGNPGMATGGSGDVLTGLVTGLLARGLSPESAAIAGVYLHGLAGDLAAEASSQESVIAGDIIRHLGGAFKITV